MQLAPARTTSEFGNRCSVRPVCLPRSDRSLLANIFSGSSNRTRSLEHVSRFKQKREAKGADIHATRAKLQKEACVSRAGVVGLRQNTQRHTDRVGNGQLQRDFVAWRLAWSDHEPTRALRSEEQLIWKTQTVHSSVDLYRESFQSSSQSLRQVESTAKPIRHKCISPQIQDTAEMQPSKTKRAKQIHQSIEFLDSRKRAVKS